MQRRQCPDFQRFRTFIWSTMWKKPLFFSDSKSFYFFEFHQCFLSARNVKVTVEVTDAEKPQKKHFKETKTLISNSYLIRQIFSWYRCKSGIEIFAWRVTWKYIYICQRRSGSAPSPWISEIYGFQEAGPNGSLAPLERKIICPSPLDLVLCKPLIYRNICRHCCSRSRYGGRRKQNQFSSSGQPTGWK